MTKSKFINKSKGYWVKNRVLEEAKKYKTSSEWKKGSVSSHSIAYKKGWDKEASKFFISKKTKLTKKQVFEKALEYNRKIDFMKKAPAHYRKALTKRWIKQCCKHMMSFKDSIKYSQKPYWTEELILEEIKNIKLWKDVIKRNDIYSAINRLGIRDKLKKKIIHGTPIKWTKQKLKKEALKYKTRQDFLKHNEFALKKIYHLKLDKQFLKHLIPWKKSLLWTDENLIKAIMECKTRSGLMQKYPGAYKRIQQNKLDFNNLFLDLTCEIERKVLHTKIKKILKSHNKLFSYEECIFLDKRKIIPDFIIKTQKIIYIIEAKTSGCYYSRKRENTSIRAQIKKQIECF